MKMTLTALSLALIATGATAQQFSGTEVGLNFGTDLSGPGPNFYSIDGSSEMDFGKFSVQFDASVFGWGGSSAIQTAASIHGIYAISDRLTLGVYVGIEDWNASEGTNYYNIGVEALYSFSNLPIVVEAYWYNNQSASFPNGYDYVSLEATYGLSEKIDIFAGYGAMSRNNVYIGNDASVGVNYAMNNGIAIRAEYTYQTNTNSNPSDLINLRLSKSFGGGVTFGQRDWSYISGGS